MRCKGGHNAHQRIACSARDETPLIPDAGRRTKLASSGPNAAPVVLSSVVIPVLFIRSSTLACTLRR